MLRIFKNKSFARFAKKSDISDTALCKAVREAEQGLIDADLGGGVIKQRVARAGQGKSGGYRTMILFKAGTRAFFVHGFAKNEKDNIEPEDLIAFRKLATRMLEYKDTELTQALNKHLLTEVICHDEKLP
ncbi:MAG: type II toxin-antitoxin system RelE/ParE family toxin [Methylococcales bacterium]|nr:type II toxin-antitoxin system RelE/ParE family toxin [Methylococcales bacterium]MDP3332417.1 type II toxin-antitoxin system RelE/ParE family toxin [Methylococcaceae bacterium]